MDLSRKLAARAREMQWQCSECKSCKVCGSKENAVSANKTNFFALTYHVLCTVETLLSLFVHCALTQAHIAGMRQVKPVCTHDLLFRSTEVKTFCLGVFWDGITIFLRNIAFYGFASTCVM